jgi:hypothetical protein
LFTNKIKIKMIQHDPITAEPYIRLPPPLSHIILTPPRLHHAEDSPFTDKDDNENEKGTPPPADISSITTALNDPRVYLNLEGPPYPYLDSHAASNIRSGYFETQRILQRAAVKEEGEWVDGCPFRDIRDTSISTSNESSGSSIAHALKIGDFRIARYAFYKFPHGSDQRRDARMRNEALPAGDEAVEWGVGCTSPTFFLRFLFCCCC